MENNYAVGLSLSFKLINTITSKSFRKSLVTQWQGAEASENIFAVNNKACNELERKIRLFERHNDISIVYNYLESLCNEHGIKVKAADKKGLIRDFTIDTYTEVSRFLREGIRISWLIFSLACNHRLHFPNGKTGWRGLEQMRKDCGTREFIAHPSVYLERSLSANLSDVPLTADNTRMEFST